MKMTLRATRPTHLQGQGDTEYTSEDAPQRYEDEMQAGQDEVKRILQEGPST